MAFNGIAYSSLKSPQHPNFAIAGQGIEPRKYSSSRLPSLKVKFAKNDLWHLARLGASLRPSTSTCYSRDARDTETTECSGQHADQSDIYRSQVADEFDVAHKGLAEACKYVYNDARYVNERARSDTILLCRGIMRLDARARRDVAILGTEFLKLDARAREDSEKIDSDVKRKAKRVHHAATILKKIAESKLKTVADRHWSDGALEADLRRADFAAKQRAMEDALMALEFVKNIHDKMVNKMYNLPVNSQNDGLDAKDPEEKITLEKNGRTLDLLPREVSADNISAIEEAYWGIASALSEADGIDYTDPEELEILFATLIDLDAMDGKGSVSLLAECSSSPDINTRKALAKALSAAPSMWTLGNAGMGALQRLAEDRNPTIAAAASRTIKQLKRQWEIEDGDSWRFMVNQIPDEDVDDKEDDD